MGWAASTLSTHTHSPALIPTPHRTRWGRQSTIRTPFMLPDAFTSAWKAPAGLLPASSRDGKSRSRYELCSGAFARLTRFTDTNKVSYGCATCLCAGRLRALPPPHAAAVARPSSPAVLSAQIT